MPTMMIVNKATPQLPEISVFKSKVNSVSDKANVNMKWLVLALLKLAEDDTPTSQDEKLRMVLAKLFELQPTNKISTINTSDIDSERVSQPFGLRYNPVDMDQNPWVLNSEPYTPPDSLLTNLKELRLARYNKQSEETCRVAIDFVIIACNMQLRNMYPDRYAAVEGTSSTTLRPSTPDTFPGLFTVFPELEMSVTIIDPATRTPLRIAGRADWAYGYDTRSGCSGPFVIAIAAKERATLSSAESQLLAYLAIMREQSNAMCKTNVVVQGFYTDGRHYTFMSINNDGKIQSSCALAVMNDAGRKTIFNFIVKMLDTAMKSTPTKPNEKRERQVAHFDAGAGKGVSCWWDSAAGDCNDG
ncbi:hypothetical protein Q9L58_009202 [Maublancomyces gigas]|uniref:Uncharacterized protein n=1 Tax=Discina gigas TaxID=1032678 RepID=A0ABR3G893_9PEZI